MRTIAFRTHADAGLRLRLAPNGPLPRLATIPRMKRFRLICLPHRPSLTPCAHVVGACPQPSGPRPRITPGAVTPPGAHGAWKSTGAATQALPPVSSPRLRKPASRSCSAGTGSATGGRACVACWGRYRLRAMRPRRRAIPARAPCGGAGRWAATLPQVAARGGADGRWAGQTEP